MSSQDPYLAVVGSGTADEELSSLAESVGREVARSGAVLVCGGLGGVMEAACRGAKEAGGHTLGILPGLDRAAGNAWLGVAVPTGLGEARNVLVVRAADAVLALPGGMGTLSEVALARKTGKCVVGVGAWGEIDGVIREDDPAEAVRRALG